MTRSLLPVETAAIWQAQDGVRVTKRQARKAAREAISAAVAERDRQIAGAVRHGANPADIARLLGLTRQAVYAAVKRAAARETGP